MTKSISEIHLKYSQFSNTGVQENSELVVFFSLQNNLRALEKQMDERNSGNYLCGDAWELQIKCFFMSFSFLTGIPHPPPTVSRGTAFVAGEASVPAQPQRAWPNASEHEAHYQYFYLKYYILRREIVWFSFRPSVS